MSEHKNEYTAAVRKMKLHITEHLQEPITSSSLAKAAGYLQFHAARIFKAETGLSAFEYIRRERLNGSAKALRSGKARVFDVALDFVFDSHEGFTRAFAKGFGIPPKKYAKAKEDGWFVPTLILDRHKTKTEGTIMSKQTTVIFTQILERPARKLILKRSKSAEDYFSYAQEFGCGKNNMSEAWDVLCDIKEALYEPVGLWLPDNMRPSNTGIYAHGVEVAADYSGTIPDGFDSIELPSCKMLVFQGEPYNEEEFGEAIGAAMAGIEKYNPEVYGYKYAPELAPRMQLSPEGWRGYIEMRPIEKA
ncbi:MAG: AraC family transcriptional regulator [Oscillospiraceae bacterium]|nr:AraC family transcriptional regulator [Oscillospiraceae bacterium]